jgi:hypothetical protein
LLTPAGAAGEDEAATPTFEAPTMRLVHLVDGLRSQPKNRNLTNTKKTEIYKTARHAGLDLEELTHPYLAHIYANNRLFYVFYKTAESAVGDRPYLIQRIKKIERTWLTEDQTAPVVKTTYQVEVFKIFAGAMKRADQHFGSYGLRGNYRREVVKEYEIGFGEVPDACEGTAWPFDPGKLFKYVQEYQEDIGVYDDVKFLSSTTWTLSVGFARDGTYHVRSPEFGFDAPEQLPDPEAHAPKKDPASKGIVLAAGKGLDGVVMGESTLEDLKAKFGEPVQTQTFPSGSANHFFGGTLVFNLDGGGKLNTIITRPEFAGATAAGIRHGDHRARVMEVMGVPKRTYADAWYWRFRGVLFYFDGYDRVSQIVVLKL